MGQSFVQDGLADGDDLDQLLLGVEKDYSQGLVSEKTHFGAEICYRQRGIDNELRPLSQ